MIIGKSLILSINGTALAASKGCELDCTQSFLAVSSPLSGRWEQSIPARLAWKVTADALLGTMSAYNMLQTALINGTALTVRFYDTSYAQNRTGTVYIESISLRGNVGELAKMSVSLRGSSALSAYDGTAISTTLEYDQVGYYLTQNGNVVSFVSEDGSLSESRLFNLTERTLVRIDPKDCLVILTDDTSIQQEFENLHDIDLSVYHATSYTSEVEMWMDAGTYVIIYSYQDDSADAPALMKMN